MSSDENTGPYKGEGETVYATSAGKGAHEVTAPDDEPIHRSKAWLYQQYHIFGLDSIEIAEKAGVAPSTIRYHLDKFEIPTRDKGEAVSKAKVDDRLWDQDWLYKKYVKEELSTTEIAELVGADESAIRNALDRFGIQTRSISEAQKIRLQDRYGDRKYNDSDWLEHQYITLGKSINEIADENDWVHETVRRHLHKHGIQVRSNTAGLLAKFKKEKGFRPTTERELVSSAGIDASWRDLKDVDKGRYVPYRDRRWLKKRIEHGLSNKEIAELCGCSRNTIHRWIDRLNIERNG